MDFYTESQTETGHSGGSDGGSGAWRPGRSPGESPLRRPYTEFVVTVLRLVLDPLAFFGHINRQGNVANPLLFSLICWEISATIGGLLGLLGSVVGLEPRSAEKAIAGFLGSPILTPIFAAVVPAIAAGIIHLLITLIARPGKTSVETTSRIVAHADATILL